MALLVLKNAKTTVFGGRPRTGTILAIWPAMSGRRSHARYAVSRSPEGVLRVLRDVVIQSTVHDHTIALSREPGILGELVMVQFPTDGHTGVQAQVLESQPVMVDGSVRYQLRLRHVDATTSAEEAGAAMSESHE